VAAGDLCDWEKVKRKLKLTNSSDDDIVQSLVSQASDYILTELRRVIVSTPLTEKYNGRSTPRLTLRKWPIISVASVLIDGVAVPASSGVTVNGWYQSGDREIALRGYAFTKGYGNVIVTYTAGYATVPVRFERACEATCLRWHRELDRIGQLSAVVGEQNVTFALGLPDDVKCLIRNERDVVPA